jgi:undecaprenyl-diphosphatase
MIETLNGWDTQLFYLINQHHCTAMDWPMWVLSSGWSWLVVIVLAYVLTALRREARRWWLPLLGIALCFLLADQGSVQLFKNTVCRLRPCHALPDVHMFREGCGGQYGFISSHAANAFAIAMFFWLRYRRWAGHGKKAALAVPIGMMVWAALTSYSRAYLGKHYPGDLLCGALFGLLMGFFSHLIINWIEKKLQKKETKE